IQVARGLHYAHTMGLAHLDLKPRNVLVERGGRVLIGDYGPLSGGAATPPEPPGLEMEGDHSKGEDQETRISGTRLLGTPQYFSPEAAAGRPAAGLASDLWALALTALECFLGRRPWEMGSMVGQALAQYLAEPGRPTYLPPPLAGYFQTALAPDPTDRYPDAETVERRLIDIYGEVAGRSYSRPSTGPEIETPERLVRKNASFRDLGRLDLCRGPD
ncbi:MAG: protein kinase, partial [Candidatus Adiutrix sp.]|nr:protein kinase [Candidatus Adiutrix sp.]